MKARCCEQGPSSASEAQGQPALHSHLGKVSGLGLLGACLLGSQRSGACWDRTLVIHGFTLLGARVCLLHPPWPP